MDWMVFTAIMVIYSWKQLGGRLVGWTDASVCQLGSFDIFSLLAPELFFFLVLAHSVYKMWIKQEPNKLEFWNKLHFEEKKKT